jgi:hypothetical protein
LEASTETQYYERVKQRGVLAVDAEKTLLFGRQNLIAAANEVGIALLA